MVYHRIPRSASMTLSRVRRPVRAGVRVRRHRCRQWRAANGASAPDLGRGATTVLAATTQIIARVSTWVRNEIRGIITKGSLFYDGYSPFAWIVADWWIPRNSCGLREVRGSPGNYQN